MTAVCTDGVVSVLLVSTWTVYSVASSQQHPNWKLHEHLHPVPSSAQRASHFKSSSEMMHFNKALVHHQKPLKSMTSPLNKDSEPPQLNTCRMWASQHPDVTSRLQAPLRFIKASPTFLPTFSLELLILFCPSPRHLSSVLTFLLQESRRQVESVLDVQYNLWKVQVLSPTEQLPLSTTAIKAV